MEIAFAPVANLLKEIAEGKADAEAVVSSMLARANGNAGKNTYLSLDAEWSCEQARRLHNYSGKRHLFGIPVALKDCFDLQGFVTSSGSRFYAQHNAPAACDSWVAARLKAAGAVVTGKTHLHQLAYGITGENRDYGDCVQPDNASLLTGGSSSGAAASIQEGSALAAIGTDTGGSVRAPAALCGLAGYRASLGLGDWPGGAHLAPSFDTIGWLCRDLRDLPLLAHALFGISTASIAERPVRVGVLSKDFMEDCDPSVLDAMSGWVERIARLGAHTEDTRPDFWTSAYEIYAPIQAHEASKLHAGYYDEFEPAIADRLRWGAAMREREVTQLRVRHADFERRTDSLFANLDFLLMPAVPVSQLTAGEDQSAARPRILRYTTPASLAGLPAVVLPARPAGMQLLAARGSDVQLLAFAHRLGSMLAADEAS
jgi:aspartyl-tRNA(Asn)/glutamyl-tRNA(Gln) amidotransferase subunit A